MMKSTRRLLFCSALAVATAMLAACAGHEVAATIPPTATSQSTGGTASPVAASDTAAVAVSQAQKVKALAVTVNKYCQVGTPFVKTMLLLQTDQKAVDALTKISGDAGPLCTVAAAIARPVAGSPLPSLDLAAIRTFANDRLPDLLTLVKNSGKLNSDQKAGAELVITGAQAALLIAAINAQ